MWASAPTEQAGGGANAPPPAAVCLVGGPALRRECIGPGNDRLRAMVPCPMCPELLYTAAIWGDYQIGMAWLTAEKIFHMVQIIKKKKSPGFAGGISDACKAQ